MGEEGEHFGQRGGFRQSYPSLMGGHICEGCKGMPREELITAAYRAVQTINSIEVRRKTSEGPHLDVERTYELL